MSDYDKWLERWPGYNQQSWPERFAELDRRFSAEMVRRDKILHAMEAAQAIRTRQSSSVDGALIKIGGAGESASIQLQDLDGKIISGFTAKRTIAKDLAHHMWEPVRLHGVGQWGRNDDGEWTLERMQVNSFDLLEDESLAVTLGKLRSANVAWPVDAVEKLLAERSGES